MSRKGQKKKRAVSPDPKYNSIQIERFTTKLMERGKKNLARNIVYGALEVLEKESGQKAPEALDVVIRNASPQIEVKSKRVGGATYQVPVEVRGERRQTLAMRWLIESARVKKGKNMAEKLGQEFALAHKNQGDAISKKDSVHKQAEANKAFAHLARY